MKMKIVHKEQIIMKDEVLTLRIKAFTDGTDYKHCKMLDMSPVKIERQVEGNSYQLISRADSIMKAGFILEDYVNNFTYGRKFARIQLSV